MGIYSSQGWSKHVYFLRTPPPPLLCNNNAVISTAFFAVRVWSAAMGGKCSQRTTGGARESGRHHRHQTPGPWLPDVGHGPPRPKKKSLKSGQEGRQAGRGRLRLRQRNIAHGSPHTTLFALSEHTVVRLSKNRLLCFASLVSYKITACKTWIYSDRFIYDPCYKATTQAI